MAKCKITPLRARKETEGSCWNCFYRCVWRWNWLKQVNTKLSCLHVESSCVTTNCIVFIHSQGQIGRYSESHTECIIEKSGYHSWQGQQLFLFSKGSRPSMVGHIHLMQIRCVAAHLYPVVQQARRDNESSSIHNTEVENRWQYTPSPIRSKGVVFNYAHKHMYLLHEHCITCSSQSVIDEATPSYEIWTVAWQLVTDVLKEPKTAIVQSTHPCL
jgi:hypothetical protein